MFWILFVFEYTSATTFHNQLDRQVLIPAKRIPANPIYRPNYRYDNNERNTSAKYDLWDQAGYSLFEWPGNITKMDSDFPLLKWGKPRSKYIESPCNSQRGLEMAAYSHKYVHLTWGQNHLRKSYCHPLRVDRKALAEHERKMKSFEITVVDFDFVFDALLIVAEKGYIIRAGNIELTYQKISGRQKRFLSYTTAKGLTQPVNRIIAQKCCSKTIDLCPNGDSVIVYREASELFTIFISKDGGHNFQEIQVSVPKSSSILHTLIFYPNWQRIYILHGSSSLVYVDAFSPINGTLCTMTRERKVRIPIHGYVQAEIIGMEMSFVIWDDCNVWLASPDHTNGLVLHSAVFYIHNSIRLDIGEVNETKTIPHVIRPTHCYLGKNSVLSIGEEGKIGLLDKNNVFLYGVDLKSKDFPFIALSTDFSLLLPEKKNTIYPCYDRNNRPKLLYPPRYLRLSNKKMMDKDYKKRLAMRIVKKTLFPSDFMNPFFEEHLKHRLPTSYEYLTISKCMTSSLSVEGSVTQKEKTIKLNFDFPSSLMITFYAYSSMSKQLNFEPLDLLSFLDIDLNPLSTVPVGGGRFWIKYGVNITLKSNYFQLFNDQDIFLLNFFTIKSLRCVHQPQFPIWLKIDQSFKRKRPIKNINREETKVRKPATLLPMSESTTNTIHHCPLQAEFDRQASAVCSQSSVH